ncbi:MAG: ADP-ribosylglycohydrolase family protein [Labilibaculum sp.]|nr:ADP-ribosylglycohydrolase family protein [Labilibaculum sp.]MBI9060230.1 ADP-ribosylglycohydrolase family protein [Labilibaculum sp.]
MKKNSFYGVLLLMLLSLNSCSKRDDYRKISVEEYQNKMKAGWIGQMVGVGWGAPTEFKYSQQTIPNEDVPEYTPEFVNQFNQDDIYVEMTFIQTLEKYGVDCTYEQAGIDFANSEYMLWGANEIGRENLRSGIKPPASGHPEFSDGADWIDYQIEADYSGIISPGMPNEVIALGEKFGRIMNYGDGLYGGMFVGGMYAEAYFENDIIKIIEAGLECIPYESQYAECMRDVVQWYKENPNDWEKSWRLIEDKYYENPEYRKYTEVSPDYWFHMDAKLNGAYILMGLLYGEGDIDKTIKISMQCGRDSDCNPSNAAGVLFTALGYNNLDEKYVSALTPDVKFSYTNYNFNELCEVSTELAKKFVLKNGGKIETANDGKEYFLIANHKAKPGKLEQSWEPQPFTGETKFTNEQKRQIKFHAHHNFTDLVKEAGSERWKIYSCASRTEPKFYSFNDKKNVIKTSLENKSSSVMFFLQDYDLTEFDKAYLNFSVSCEEEGEINLSLKINYQAPMLEETINAGNLTNGWKNYKIDVTEFIGPKVTFMLGHSGGNKSNTDAYWHNLKITSK